MAESVERLRALRRRIASIERSRPVANASRAGIGHTAIDAHLGGGIARGRLHELFAIDAADASAATGFAAMLSLRLGGMLVWLRGDDAEARGGRLHAPGLAEIGVDPGRMLLVVLPDPLAVLRAAAEVVRCPEVGVAVVELWKSPRQLDLTASRRLAVAVETSGVTALMLRADAEPAPSAAETRWAVRAAASTPLEADAPGHPALEIELLRQRGAPPTRVGGWSGIVTKDCSAMPATRRFLALWFPLLPADRLALETCGWSDENLLCSRARAGVQEPQTVSL